MTIETNGAITPEDAVAYAARILQDQLNVFVNFEEPRKEVRRRSFPISRSTRRSSRRSTNSNCRCVRQTA
jgi:DNA-directed RNA polymerase alpha subunit